MPSAQRYFVTIDSLSTARGENNTLSFKGESPDTFALVLQTALREPTLWEQWRSMEDEPDEVDPLGGATDAAASVTANLAGERTEVKITTTLPHALVKHRLDLLIGKSWKLRDVSAA